MSDVNPEAAVERLESEKDVQWQLDDAGVKVKAAKWNHVFRTWDVITINKHHTLVCYLVIGLLAFLTLQFRADARYYYERSLEEIPFYFVNDWYGQTKTLADMPPESFIYRFALSIWTRLQVCVQDCSSDLPDNLIANSPYLTQGGFNEVEAMLKELNYKDQLRGVQRALIPDDEHRFDHTSVEKYQEGDGWRVKLVLRVSETLGNTPIKRMVPIEYNLVIVRMPIDAHNDSGLAIAGTEEHLNRRL